jgi:hypothetical protein
MVTGTGTDLFARRLLAANVPRENVLVLGDAGGPEIIGAIAERSTASTMILGMGNIAGPGMSLADFFEHAEPWPGEDFQENTFPVSHQCAESDSSLVLARAA